ncbi:MAG: phosphoglycerate dehydrogenase [Lachnospiraceae bacterium]|nr:phosphoglycerate dehydrogenase [Lachnospiraceae bacterium]MDD2957811.1 phosphoglycerate dehydrogenase [Lachnospiraceae bacterium]
MKILVTPTSLQPGKNDKMLQKLKNFSEDLVFNETGRPLTEEELGEALADCDGYIAGLDFVTEKALENCSKLKVISRYGAGVDRVDLQAAKAKGIKVTNTPGVNAEAVGELAFGLILSAARKISYLDQQTRAGEWVRSSGMELSGKTIGIFGLGAIGKVVARCAKGFDMKVMAYDPFINEEYCRQNDIQAASMEEVLKAANVISLHLPLLDSTKHLINEQAFQMMKEGTIVINASRGGIIDEAAAYDALKSGKLGGLGLDAFEVEPPKASPLFEFPNVVVTPHTGAHTKEATDNMAQAAIDNLIAVLSGEECRFVVNR